MSKMFLFFGPESYFLKIHLTKADHDQSPFEIQATREEFKLAVIGKIMDKTLYSTDGHVWKLSKKEAQNGS